MSRITDFELSFEDALNIARGCTDYGGGHHDDGKMDAYQHGIQTVINALEAAKKNSLDSQVAFLKAHGRYLSTEKSKRRNKKPHNR
jgi:hypothetical protein